jgi:hypothetical protein
MDSRDEVMPAFADAPILATAPVAGQRALPGNLTTTFHPDHL